MLGDRIGVILNNRLCQVDAPEKLFRTPSNYDVACFLGMLNVFPVKWVREGVCRASGVDIHAVDANPSTTYLWVKPEEIVLSRQKFDSSALNQYAGKVSGWEHHGSLLAVRLECGALSLVVAHYFHVVRAFGNSRGNRDVCHFQKFGRALLLISEYPLEPFRSGATGAAVDSTSRAYDCALKFRSKSEASKSFESRQYQIT